MKKTSFRDMSSSSRGFTLIEVLIASVVLSTVFFAILTLTSNNARLSTNLRNNQTMDELFLSSKACIKSFWYNNLIGVTGTQSVHFGENNLGCFTGTYQASLAFTGISLEQKNDTETGSTVFWSYFSVRNETGGLLINNTLTDGIEKKEYDFTVRP